MSSMEILLRDILCSAYSQVDAENDLPSDFTIHEYSPFISRADNLASSIYIIKAVSGNISRPCFILKIQKDKSHLIVSEMIKSEYSALNIMSGKRYSELSFPKPILLSELNGRTFSLMTYLPGPTMNEKMLKEPSLDELSKYMRLSVDWLFSFYEKTRSGTCALKDIFNASHMNDAFLFKEYFKNIEGVDLTTIKNGFQSGIEVPQYAHHGDFFVSNIILNDENRINGIVDLEEFKMRGVPLLDLFHFFITFTRALKRTGLDRKLSVNKKYFDEISSYYGSYLIKTGISSEAARILFKYYLIHSVNRFLRRERRNLKIAEYLLEKAKQDPKDLLDAVMKELDF